MVIELEVEVDGLDCSLNGGRWESKEGIIPAYGVVELGTRAFTRTVENECLRYRSNLTTEQRHDVI